MAKDILINAQSGELLISQSTSQLSYWEVIWGKMFNTDEFEYMNIVVPSGYINDVNFQNNQFECRVKAEYYPINSNFLARLIVFDIANHEYVTIQKYNINAPRPAAVVYRPKYTGRLKEAMACQLPIIDVDGEFNLLFQQYGSDTFANAVISSAKDVDFSIGDSDSQSAQMLARCAPGKYYRYPTTGLDLTKYINSVAEHTDIVTSLVSQFKSDSKQISEAEFDSSTGDLQVVFSGTNEAEDEDLTPTNLLNVELFKITTDDYIRSVYESSHNLLSSGADFIAGLTDGSFAGIYDIGRSAKLDKDVIVSFTSGTLDGSGNVVSAEKTSYVATMALEAGKLYVADYDADVIYIKDSKWHCDSLFAIYMEDNESTVYIDEPFTTNIESEYISFANSFVNRRCFIPLQNLIIRFYAGASNVISDMKYGVWPIVDEPSNYKSILGLDADDITGKLSAIVSIQTDIKDVQVDLTTNRILVIKSNT